MALAKFNYLLRLIVSVSMIELFLPIEGVTAIQGMPEMQ